MCNRDYDDKQSYDYEQDLEELFKREEAFSYMFTVTILLLVLVTTIYLVFTAEEDTRADKSNVSNSSSVISDSCK